MVKAPVLSSSFALRSAARGAGSLLFLGLFVAGGCADEVGGDGWEPPQPASTAGSSGMAGGVGGDDTPATSGSGGSSGTKGGTGGKGGTKGTGGTAGTGLIIEEGGMGGQETSGAVCGNNVVEDGEECDDGNTKSFDGCSADCKKSCEICERTYCSALRKGPVGPYTDDGLLPADVIDNLLKLGLKENGTYATLGSGPLAPDGPYNAAALDMVDCIRRERCAQFLPDDSPSVINTFARCFCDRDLTETSWFNDCRLLPPDDPKDEVPGTKYYVPGKCSREIWGASDKQLLSDTLLANANNYQKPFGAATTLLVGCDLSLCREECFPEQSQGAIAQITEDIVLESNGAGESPIGDLIADAQRSSLGADIAFVHDEAWVSQFATFGLIYKATPGRPADADGRVLESEVHQMLSGTSPPFNLLGGNRLGTIAMTGDQVYKVLEAYWGHIQVSGLAVTWDAAVVSPNPRITQVKKGDVLLDKSATYTVACNDLFATRIVNTLSNQVVFTATEKQPQAELISYLKAQTQAIASPTLNRFTKLN